MIPEFPKFKKLELSDKEDIEKFTHKFPPYSDFNFTSMWSWDTHNKMRISQLHKNLVVLFDDYVSNKPFLSFIGGDRLSETATDLITFSKKQYREPSLKLISEEIAHVLERSGFIIRADRDAYDYIYSVAHLAKMDSWPASGISKRIRKFVKNNPGYVISISSVKDIPTDEYIKIFKKWAKNKKVGDHLDLNEYKAFERFLRVEDKNIEVISMHVNDELIGFTLYELLTGHCAISHFVKSDTGSYDGINDVMNWEEAKRLYAKGVKYYNWEQDLGILGLRYSKVKYNPSLLMKKFIVTNK